MKQLRRACFAILASVMASLSGAQQVGNAAFNRLDFLSGRWMSEKPGEMQEETWSPVNGDSVIGSFRIVRSGRPVFYEFWVVETEENRPVLKLKHFNANLAGWEEKNDSTRMPLVSSSEGDAIFAATNGSVSLHYHRQGNLLTCTVHHGRNGNGSDEVFTLTRAPCD
jgi:hypothetical protein